MTDSDWQDLMVGDRMAVDRQFSERVAASRFSSQEWGLIMTAVEFRIEDPGDAENARLVADTSKVEQIVPELEKVRDAQGAMGGPGGGGSRGGGSSGGFLGSVKDALGIGGADGGDHAEVVGRADAMTNEYAGLLQDRLENEGKWERIRTAAAASAGGGDAGTGDATGAGDAGAEDAASGDAEDGSSD